MVTSSGLLNQNSLRITKKCSGPGGWILYIMSSSLYYLRLIGKGYVNDRLKDFPSSPSFHDKLMAKMNGLRRFWGMHCDSKIYWTLPTLEEAIMEWLILHLEEIFRYKNRCSRFLIILLFEDAIKVNECSVTLI